jgi:hypothetical protein
MRGSRLRAAATVSALAALVLLVGGAVFLAAREDAVAPTTTTIPTTTTAAESVIVKAISEALQRDLTVPLSMTEADCVAAALVAVVDVDRLEALADHAAPLTSLTRPEHDQLVQGVVRCVPPDKASAMLGSATTTGPPVSLPDEDL